MRKHFMAMDNGQIGHSITRNVNMDSKWKFLSGEREYDLKKDQSLGSSANKKWKRGRKEEDKVKLRTLESSKLPSHLAKLDFEQLCETQIEGI